MDRGSRAGVLGFSPSRCRSRAAIGSLTPGEDENIMAIESRGDGDGAEYLDVLLLCAAPLDVRPALNLAVEVANFEAEVRRSPVPIRLRRVFPPTYEQLCRELAPTALQGREPRVFHFLGHGEEDYLWFEDEEGSGERVTAARLRTVFED